MALCNHKFNPSVIEDRIYDLMTEPENIFGSELYSMNLLTDVVNMLQEEFPNVEWEAFASPTREKDNYTMSFAWVENGHVHLIGWDYKEEIV